MLGSFLGEPPGLGPELTRRPHSAQRHGQVHHQGRYRSATALSPKERRSAAVRDAARLRRGSA
jgi:hypothetical protein